MKLKKNLKFDLNKYKIYKYDKYDRFKLHLIQV